jgi:hypothetical protein
MAVIKADASFGIAVFSLGIMPDFTEKTTSRLLLLLLLVYRIVFPEFAKFTTCICRGADKTLAAPISWFADGLKKLEQ